MSALFWAASANALPSLQLGPGDGPWNYCTDTCLAGNDTWELLASDDPITFELNAYANALAIDGGNGDYAWDSTSTPQYAYLVVAAIPSLGTDPFDDVTVVNVGGDITMLTSGFGTPPVEDPNSLPGHGIFDTYFEIYKFEFDGMFGTIFNTEPGEIGSGQGFTELFEITINMVDESVAGLHFVHDEQ